MDDIHHDNERHQVENYMKLYCLEELLDETVNVILERRPENPYVELARLIENKSMAEILDVSIDAAFGENAKCIVSATIVTNIGSFNGLCGMATKSFLEDEDILKDFSIATGKVNDILTGMDPRNLREIDEKLCASANLNPSVIVALGIACCRAGARHRGTNLYQFLAEQVDNSDMQIPVPVCTPVVRSATGRDNLDGLPLLQDITLTPTTTPSFDVAIESLNAATNLINRAITSNKVTTSIYRERGAVNVVMGGAEDALAVVSPVLEAMHGNAGVRIGLDARSNGFIYTMPVPEDSKPGTVGDVYYVWEAVDLPAELSPRSAAAAAGGKGAKADPKADPSAPPPEPPVPSNAKTSADISSGYVDLWKTHGLMTLEEPFHVGDIAGLKAFKQKISNIVQNSAHECPAILSYAIHEGIGNDVNCHLQIVADASVKSVEDLERLDPEGVFDTLKVNLFKVGSVYKALQLAKAAKAAKWSLIVGCEEQCVETSDTFISDFAVAVGAGQFNGGGFGSGECTAKYNRILEISREFDGITFAGRNFRG